jgi:hypothetical protein
VGYLGNGAAALSMWGAQIETGSRATSPIPTFAATVTRTIDNVRWPDFMDAEGVVVVEWVPLVAADASSPVLLGHNAAGTTSLFSDASSVGHFNGAQVLAAGAAATAGARNRVAFAWSPAGRAISLNGGAVATDANAVGTTDTARFGAAGDGSQPWPALMTRIRTAPRRPPNDRVRTLGIVS